MSETRLAHQLLHKHFGYREFLDGQEEVVTSIVDGHDVVVIMPTGGGKSLCYQLPALILEGITVVVSPLIALMKDQVDTLIAKKIQATSINSSLSQHEIDSRIEGLKSGRFRLLYIAPERFKSERFVRALAPLSISLFAIDEAHCISQWGHDFRPDYIRLKYAIKDLGNPQIAALTATATPEVRDDIIEQLGLGKSGRNAPQIFVSGFARDNLTLGVTHTANKADKLANIANSVQQLKTGIIYCSTRKNVERVSKSLKEMRISHVSYHAGMTDEQRTKAQEKFMFGKCSVAVATNAFGMGIDRADLRFVTHYDIPGSIEAYYQEAGRAGRDGEPSRCELLYNYADVRTQEFFIDGANPTVDIIHALYHVLRTLCKRGPVEKSISEFAEYIPGSNEMAVGTALHLLHRANFIERSYEGSRTYTTELITPIKELDNLEIDFKRLELKRQRDMAKLKSMIKYADHSTCRHQYILKYFGDVEAGEKCTICDNCLSKFSSSARFPTEQEMIIVQKALSCVARLNGRFGKGRIAQTLIGSRSKEVIDAGLDKISTYGLLTELGPDYVRSLLNILISSNCLSASNTDYPTLSITELGGEVMRRKKAISLALPTLDTKKIKKRERTREIPENETSSYDSELFEALRQWRKKTASALGNIPAYHLYPDKTLKELSARKPQTLDDLLEVRGIGPGKARQFGPETLSIIQNFIK